MGISAADMQAALLELPTIDGVQVSRAISPNLRSVSFAVTFTGAMVRGSVPLLVVLDQGSNGCSPTAVDPAVVTQTRYSAVSVYRLETSAPLPYDASEEEMKDALEALSLVTRVDVSRSVNGNGFEWDLTFRGYGDFLFPLYVNFQNLTAAIGASASVTPIGQFLFEGLIPGVAYSVTGFAVNTMGSGTILASTPVSQQPADQVPMPPSNILVRAVYAQMINVQFTGPYTTYAGPVVSSYLIHYDPSPAFSSGVLGNPYGEVELSSSASSLRLDVQALSVVAPLGYTAGGTFSLSFLGHTTFQLDYNISGDGVKSALEALPPVRQVAVSREIFCSASKGVNDCGNLRGYTWRVTFVDVIDSGDQFEAYFDSFESNYNYRLAVDGTYLKACPPSDPLACYVNSSAQAFVHAHQEIQQLCICNSGLTAINFLSQTTNCSSSAGSLTQALEGLDGVGRVAVAIDQTNVNCGCSSGLATQFSVAFETMQGDVPLVVLSQGQAVELIKGRSQFVEGLDEYSLLLDDPIFSSKVPIYVRVAAVNSVGASSFYDYPSPIIPYFGAPPPPKGLSASTPSSSTIEISWTPTGNYTNGEYVVEWDTNAAFVSSCLGATCSAQTVVALGAMRISYSPSSPIFGALITGLTPGLNYYVRVSNCVASGSDSLCSSYVYLGYPLDPLPVTPQDVPTFILGGAVTSVVPSSIALGFNRPLTLPEGVQGSLIESYAVVMSSPVLEVQQLALSNIPTSASFLSLAVRGMSTRCISRSASVEEFAFALQDLPMVDQVNVTLNGSGTNELVLQFAFSGVTKSGGSVGPVELGHNPLCGFTNNAAPVSSVTTLSLAVKPFVPAIVNVATSASSYISGSFEFRYGFLGDHVKLLTVDGSSPITCSIIGGQNSLLASVLLSNLLSAGATIRIGEQVHSVVAVNSSTATFSPYRIHSASNVEILVMDTFIGLAQASNGTSSIVLTTNVQGEFDVGDALLLSQYDPVSLIELMSMVVTISSISGRNIVVSKSLHLASSAPVLVYRQQSRLIAADELSGDLQGKLQSMSAIQSVSTARQGPNAVGAYSWTVTFTSDTVLSSYMVNSNSSNAIQVTLCSNTFVNGLYVSDSFTIGRRFYSMVDGPFSLYFDGAISKWGFAVVNGTSTVDVETSSSGVIYPWLAAFGSCSVNYLGSTTILSGYGASVSASQTQTSLGPDLTNTVFSESLSNRSSEVQAVTVTSVDGLLFGGFDIDFNQSFIPLTMRADESAYDFQTKLHSLPTVGRVEVVRNQVNGSGGSFLGYEWLVTFTSQDGDLPLMTVNSSATYGASLQGRNISLAVSEVAKGVPLSKEVVVEGLELGRQYSTQVVPTNSLGAGMSSFLGQNLGVGITPLSIDLTDPPDAPALNSVNPVSASQLEIGFTPGANGGSAISKYLGIIGY